MKRANTEILLIGMILAVALLVRVWGIDFGLPYLYHPDEPRYVLSAQFLFKTFDIDPHNLPNLSSSSFVYVVNALAYAPYYLAGKLSGVFQSPADIPEPRLLVTGTGHIAQSGAFLLGRIVTMLFGIANVLLVFWIGRRWLKSPAIGLLAAFMLATSPVNVYHSRLVTPDTFVVFFVLAVFWGATQIYRSDARMPFVLTGVALGCLVSTKINGIIIVFPVLIAHLFRKSLKGFLNANLLLMFTAGILAYVATTPYIFGDPRDVFMDIVYEGAHYASGHAGMEGSSLVWYLDYMWQTAGFISIAAILEILRGLRARSTEIFLLSVFPLVYFIFISSFVVRNDRTFLPLTPFLFLLAASFLVHLWRRAKGLEPGQVRRLAVSALALLAVIGLVLPISKTVTDTLQLTAVDSRETSRVWIEKNLPPGTKIAIEAYSPFVEPALYSVQPFWMMTDHEPEWYVDNGFEYLVFSQGMYGRFYAEPEKYSLEISRYERFFERFTPVKIFGDGDYEIRLYRTR